MVIVHHTVVNCYCTIGSDVGADSNCRIMSHHHKEQINIDISRYLKTFSKESL